MGSFVDWIQSTALALGGPGLFIIAFLDSSFLSLPEINDILLIWMVTQHKARMPYYALASMLGSVAGCLVLYYIGRVSEQWVARRFSADRMVMDYVLHSYIPAAGGTSSEMSRF